MHPNARLVFSKDVVKTLEQVPVTFFLESNLNLVYISSARRVARILNLMGARTKEYETTLAIRIFHPVHNLKVLRKLVRGKRDIGAKKLLRVGSGKKASRFSLLATLEAFTSADNAAFRAIVAYEGLTTRGESGKRRHFGKPKKSSAFE